MQLAFLLLSEVVELDAECLRSTLAQAWEKPVAIKEDDPGEGARFAIAAAHSLILVPVPVPVPEEEGEAMADYSVSSLATGWHPRAHEADLIVTLQDEAAPSALHRLLRFTRLLAGVIEGVDHVKPKSSMTARFCSSKCSFLLVPCCEAHQANKREIVLPLQVEVHVNGHRKFERPFFASPHLIPGRPTSTWQPQAPYARPDEGQPTWRRPRARLLQHRCGLTEPTRPHHPCDLREGRKPGRNLDNSILHHTCKHSNSLHSPRTPVVFRHQELENWDSSFVAIRTSRTGARFESQSICNGQVCFREWRGLQILL